MAANSHKTQHGNRVIAGIIPARLASTRLPRKVLRTLAGRPLLAWVVDAARACPQLDEVVVATDSEEVVQLCEREGWAVRMTSSALQSGTDRLHAVAQELAPRLGANAIYVNIQGDEPLLQPAHIAALLKPFTREHVQVATIKTLCTPENVNNPNAVKIVTAADGRALYFSRATIPFDRDATGATEYWKHIGLYAYRKQALDRFAALPPSPLELTERLEQLRFLDNGIDIYAEPVHTDTIGVDTEDDLRVVEEILRRRLKQSPLL
jgi:3-deoxy-manno-octulosonate cytidylyltransferase (CMP-KDO synthetase)